MIDTQTIRKYGAHNIVLLGLFALSLLIAKIIVVSRSTIILSEPIELTGTGLSIRLPNKNGWDSQKKWQFQENRFVISSTYNPTGRALASFQCSYLLAATNRESADWLQQQFDSEIIKTGSIETDALVFKWIFIPETIGKMNLLMATAQLPDERWLDIEIAEAMGEPKLANELLKKITATVKYQPSELLRRGEELVARLKSIGLDENLSPDHEPAFFIIEDAAENEIGFTMDYTIYKPTSESITIESTGFLYMVFSGRVREEASLFQCDDKLTRFSWQSQSRLNNRQTATELNLRDDGILSIIEGPAERFEQQIRPGSAAIPFAIIDALFGIMLERGYDRVMVDVIQEDGQIIPTIISTDKPRGDSGADYLFTLRRINESKQSDQFYLDSNRRVVQRIVRQNGIYLLRQASLDEVLRKFPERADFILQRHRMFSDI